MMLLLILAAQSRVSLFNLTESLDIPATQQRREFTPVHKFFKVERHALSY